MELIMKAYLLDNLELKEIDVIHPIEIIDKDYIRTTKGPIHKAFIISAEKLFTTQTRLTEIIKLKDIYLKDEAKFLYQEMPKLRLV